MRSFASDNNSGVHPLVMEAILKANSDHAIGYGDDIWTREAVALIKQTFTPACEPIFVFNGTGSNMIALQLLTRPYHSILCAETAHIYVDECGGPVKCTGCQIRPIVTPDGKLTPELIKPYLHGFGEQHHSQPDVIYLSQCTELGTVYTTEELKAITRLAHSHNMYVHVDGARIANACAALDVSLKELTVDCGVDVLSLGASFGFSVSTTIICIPATGVKPVKEGYKEFAIEPVLGGLKWMEGTVPTPNGEILIYMDKKTLKVKATEGKGYVYVHSKKKPQSSTKEEPERVNNGLYRFWISTEEEVIIEY